MVPGLTRARLAIASALLTGLTVPARAQPEMAETTTLSVPEPSSLLLLGGALAGAFVVLSWIRRRRR